MTEEEYADFTARLEHYNISQAEFISQAITRATIRPIVTVSPVNDELLDEGMSELQTLKTAIHEIAHAKLHDIDLNAPAEEQPDRPDRRTREVQALYPCFHNVAWESGKERI